MAQDSAVDPLANFTIHTVPYKTIAGHDILADISFPKGLQPGLHPVVINWHGGALATGSRNFRPFYPPWLEPFARHNSAIVISADYRLLPESKVADIMEDLTSFWEWLHASFDTVLQGISHGEHQADLSRIILNGGSAGGWCAFQLALDHPEAIRAVMVQYPGVGLDEPVDSEDPRNADKKMLGMQVWSKEKLNDSLKALNYDVPVTEGGWERVPLFFAAKAWGLLYQWQAAVPSPSQRIKEGTQLPPKVSVLDPNLGAILTDLTSWLIHGREDSVVPISSSEKLITKIQQFCPDTELKVEFFSGEHGFDNTIDPEKLQAGLDWVASTW